MTALPTYPLTFDDVLIMPVDGKRRELIDGALIVSPLTEWRQQDLSALLLGEFRAAARLAGGGKALAGPVGVELWSDRVLQPDLVFVSKDRLHLLNDPWADHGSVGHRG